MVRYRNPNAPAAEGVEGARPPPIDVEDEPAEYRNDVSKIFVSLNNTGSQNAEDDAIERAAGNGSTSSSGSGAGGAEVRRGRRQRRGGEGRNIRRSEPESPRDEGALAEYFSSLFDESFCCHEFKLVGSRIFSSGRFEEEQAAGSSRGDGRDVNADGNVCSDSRAEGDNSNQSMGSSVGSSADMVREGSTSQLSDGDPWGWFDELEDGGGALGGGPGAAAPHVTKATPPYILTESLSAQKLWRETAGKRPRQPSPERAYFEQQWAKNFSDSEVDYSAPLRATESSTTRRSRKTTQVLYRAANPFGSAVSKSFMCDECNQITSIMVHIPKFQIVQTGSDVHAEYLIVVGLGAVTLGVWRRFSEFKRLANKLASSSRKHQFHNALCSWRCLRERQRWFRCLDRDYLVLKTFLLERFLHDFVFESVSPNTVRDFLGVL